MPRRKGKKRYSPKKRNTLSKRVSRLSRQIRVVKPEAKRHGITYTSSVANLASGSVVPRALSSIAAGTTANTRVGHRVRPYRWRMRMEFRLPATRVSQVVRVIIVQMHDDNVITHGLDRVLEFTGPTFMRSFRNMDRVKTIKVLYDKTIALSALAGAGTNSWTFRASKRMNALKEMVWDDGLGNSDTTGGLGAYVFTSEVTERAIYDLYWRVYFTDS